MKILICNNYGDICIRLIERLKKEKQEIYLITGSQETQKNSAFQTYAFPYGSESIPRIFNNVRPDIMIVMGCFDPLYSWRDEQKQSVEYISGLSNLILAAKHAGVRQIVYASTLDVYEQNGREEIVKETLPLAGSLRLKTFLQAERLLSEFAEESFEMSVLRFPEIYGKLDYDRFDVCQRMVRECVENQKGTYYPGIYHRILYMDDAVECMMQCVFREKTESMYWIRGEEYKEEQIVDTLKKISEKSGSPVEWESCSLEAEEVPHRLELDHKLCGYDLVRIKYPMETGLEHLYHQCRQKNIKENKKKQLKESAWEKVMIPALETVGLFILIVLLSRWLSHTWVKDSLNLYLIYVVIIAATYGIAHGLFASALSSVFQIAVLVSSSGIQVFSNDYSVFVGILEIVVVGVLTGFMRDKYKRKNNDLSDENTYLSSELKDIEKINDSNAYVKQIYEERLVNYKNSMAKLYEITAQLDFMESRKVMFGAIKVIMNMMDTKDVSIYVSSKKSGYYRLNASGSEKAAGLGRSLCIDHSSSLYRTISKKEVFVNREMNPDYPVYAGATYSGEEIEAVIMIWVEDLNKINLYYTNMVALLCRLIEKAVTRAILYEQSIFRDACLEGTEVLNETAMAKAIQTCQEGRNQGLLEYVILETGIKDASVFEQVRRYIRDTDVLGLHEGTLWILLTNTKTEDAQYVIARIEQAGLSSQIVEWKE